MRIEITLNAVVLCALAFVIGIWSDMYVRR